MLLQIHHHLKDQHEGKCVIGVDLNDSDRLKLFRDPRLLRLHVLTALSKCLLHPERKTFVDMNRFTLKFLQRIKDWKQNISRPELPYIKMKR